MLDVRRRKGFWCTRHRRYGWDLEVGRLGPGRSRAMAGPRPLEKCIALEPRGARRSGGPATIRPCLEHTAEYFMDPDIDCSLLTMAWRGYPHGGLRRQRANDTGLPPFLPRPGLALEWGTLRPWRLSRDCAHRGAATRGP